MKKRPLMLAVVALVALWASRPVLAEERNPFSPKVLLASSDGGKDQSNTRPPKRRKNLASQYKITASVRKMGYDIVALSGRIGNGPACDNMQITIVARNESGMKARFVVNTRLSRNFGSTIFEGEKKVKGTGRDNSEWSISKTIVKCFD